MLARRLHWGHFGKTPSDFASVCIGGMCEDSPGSACLNVLGPAYSYSVDAGAGKGAPTGHVPSPQPPSRNNNTAATGSERRPN